MYKRFAACNAGALSAVTAQRKRPSSPSTNRTRCDPRWPSCIQCQHLVCNYSQIVRLGLLSCASSKNIMGLVCSLSFSCACFSVFLFFFFFFAPDLWYALLNAHYCLRLPKHRIHVITEILQTEKIYVEDLKSVIDVCGSMHSLFMRMTSAGGHHVYTHFHVVAPGFFSLIYVD